MKIQLYSILVCVFFLTACSPQYTYFTKSLYEQEKWTEEDIMRIQFFISEDIVLSRFLSEGETSISEGKIVIVEGRKVQQVVIEAYTPGVLVFMPATDRFAISFEEGDDDAYLMFGPNPKYEDRYALLAQDWAEESGQVHYKAQIYQVDVNSAFAALMVDLKQGEDQYETKNVQGRTVKGS